MNDFLRSLEPVDFSILAAVILLGLIGYVIGRARGRAGFGAIMGALLGPIGWLIVICLPHEGRKCPECLGVIPQQARRCKHCGVDIQAARPSHLVPR